MNSKFREPTTKPVAIDVKETKMALNWSVFFFLQYYKHNFFYLFSRVNNHFTIGSCYSAKHESQGCCT